MKVLFCLTLFVAYTFASAVTTSAPGPTTSDMATSESGGASEVTDPPPNNAAGIGGGGGGGAVLFILFVVWFCLRGKFWWRSTSHKRGCCAEDSCCAKSCCGPMCGCKPWDAQPPPHSEYWCSAGWPCKEDGRKASAYRVAPCFPHNPVAWCTNIDDYDDEAHPCGLGCGCMCNWLPGCCCLLPPKPLLILLCEDVVIESEVDEGACDCSCCPCGGCTCCPCCSDEAGKKSSK